MTTPTNPYVGPRTFSEKDAHLYFGREQESRDLTARIVSERLLLFYAQSGAGKSSLINTRILPRLRDEEGFIVLPVGRVSGELPPGVESVENIYAFNLMNSLDQSSDDPGRLADVCLNDFLARLARETVLEDDGERVTRWVYKPEIKIERGGDKVPASGPRFALVIDQFEEVITSNPDHWQEREAFFRQLNEALIDDPNLWVVLTLREDFIAALDPYAPLVLNRMRARFYMERMDGKGALEAVRRPAELGGRPFAPGVAEQLVDDLRQVRVPGQEETLPSQYVEPVQLQVVCYQMWENLEEGGGGAQITAVDLEESGDVDQALTEFYEETLLAVLSDPECPEVDERQLRRWFDRELITAAGTRGLVHQGQKTTGGLPNEVVDLLQERFLVRTELRAGATWVELVHDRFVKPIHESNNAWFDANLSVLQRQALLWENEERSPDLLLRGDALHDAEAWAEGREKSLPDYEKEFLAASQLADKEASVREQRRTRLIATLAALALIVGMVFLVYINITNAQKNVLIAEQSQLEADIAQATAENAREESIRASEDRERAIVAQATAVSQAEENATLAAEAEIEADNARVQQAAAEAAQGTAVAAQIEAEAAQIQAETALNQAQVANTAEANALATSAANLELAFAVLTRQASGLIPVTGGGPPLATSTATAIPGSGDSGGSGDGGFTTSSVPNVTATPTVELTPTPTPMPEETEAYSEVDQLVAQWEQIQATRAGLEEEADTPASVDIIANWRGMILRSEADGNATEVTEVVPWDRARVLDSENDRWLLVEAEDGTSGWVDGRWRIYEGDADALPNGLRYRVITDREDLPFVFGWVKRTEETADHYQLRLTPDFEAEALVEVPLGTEVVVLQANQGNNSEWLLVTVANIGGDRLIRTAYLPRSVVEEVAPFDTPDSLAEIAACRGAPRPRLTVGELARVAFTTGDPNSIRQEPASGTILGRAPEGSEMVVLEGPECANRRLWWLVETDEGLTGWTAEGRPGEYWLEPESSN